MFYHSWPLSFRAALLPPAVDQNMSFHVCPHTAYEESNSGCDAIKGAANTFQTKIVCLYFSCRWVVTACVLLVSGRCFALHVSYSQCTSVQPCRSAYSVDRSNTDPWAALWTWFMQTRQAVQTTLSNTENVGRWQWGFRVWLVSCSNSCMWEECDIGLTWSRRAWSRWKPSRWCTVYTCLIQCWYSYFGIKSGWYITNVRVV